MLWYQGVFPFLLLLACLKLVSGKRGEQSEDYTEPKRYDLLCLRQKSCVVQVGDQLLGEVRDSFRSS